MSQPTDPTSATQPRPRWRVRLVRNPWLSLGLHVDHHGPFIQLHLPGVIVTAGRVHGGTVTQRCPCGRADSRTVVGNRNRGLYEKFVVQRTDGSSAKGGKHDGCAYFVLDVSHDPHALAALRAYADSCEDDYPMLADDLRAWEKRQSTPDALFANPRFDDDAATEVA